MSHTLHHESILTNEAAEFINEWNNSSRYVKAHTSGTTGTPKDILLLKDDMRASARATIKFFGIGESSLEARLREDVDPRYSALSVVNPV